MVMVLRIPQPDFAAGGNVDKQGKCLQFTITREYDPWFGVGEDESEAIAICNGDNDGIVCPKRHECLIFALKNNEAHGVWGGMYLDDRTVLRRFTEEKQWAWHAPTPREDEIEAEAESSQVA